MKQLLLIFCLINLELKPLKAQEISSNKLTDKYWGIYNQSPLYYSENDSLFLKNVPNIKAAIEYPYWGGFIFYSNGQFKAKLKRKCGMDRSDYEGNWIQHNDTLILKISVNQYWNFKILNIQENKLLIKYWMKKTEG